MVCKVNNEQNYFSDTDIHYRYELIIYMDGSSKENSGNIINMKNSYYFGETDNKFDIIKSEYPILINNCEIEYDGGTGQSGDVLLNTYLMKVNDSCNNEQYKDMYIQGILLNFSNVTNNLDINNYQIEIIISDQVISDDMYFINDNYVYILPVVIGNKVDFTTKIKITNLEGEVLLHYNHHTQYD